jgi:sec-independent protein translocase protein TatB
MEKKWAAENERIMREHPAQPPMIEGEMVPLGGPPEAQPATDVPMPAPVDIEAEPAKTPLP